MNVYVTISERSFIIWELQAYYLSLSVTYLSIMEKTDRHPDRPYNWNSFLSYYIKKIIGNSSLSLRYNDRLVLR
jgi:hypothetical protein